MSVIGDIIGIPDDDRPEIFDTFDRILSANSPDAQSTEQDQLELFGNIFAYALELTAEKRRNPTDDIWSTLTTAVQNPQRRLAGVSPSYSDGVLVCPTASGAIIAVDLTTRSLLWGYRYSGASPMPTA